MAFRHYKLTPTSKYRCLHIAWYRELKRGQNNPHGLAWVLIDLEQTDNRQSPWCTEPSTTHARWCRYYPDLAEDVSSARPTTSPPYALAAAPTALTIGQNFNDLIKSVINDRLLRNEASQFFLQRVNDSFERDCSIDLPNDDTDTQVYFFDIVTKANEERYENDFIAFGLDIESMIGDSMFQSNSCHLERTMAHIMRVDWRAVLVELGVECNVSPHDRLRAY